MKKMAKHHRRRTLGPIGDFKRFRIHHQIFFSLVGILGVIMVWRGIWTSFEIVPFLEHPFTQIIVGFILVVFSGAFFKML